MKCITGKVEHDSEEIALEVLIKNRIRYDHREGSGPIDVYQCAECAAWHFTSSGPPASVLQEEEVIERIRTEKRLLDWSDKF